MLLTKIIYVNKKMMKKETNYSTYVFQGKELLWYSFLGVLQVLLLSKCFYDSMFSSFLFLPFIYLYLEKKRKALCNRRKKQLEQEFRDVILSVLANIQAGYSVENAFLESYQDIVMLYGAESDMARELRLLRQKLRVNQSIEDVLQNLADRSGVTDIRDFAETFQIAKRTGGDWKGMISNTAAILRDKQEVRRELHTLLTQRKLELQIMRYIPFAIIGYLSLTSRGYFDVLYHNVFGVLVMTGCLLVYVVAVYLAEQILDIDFK